MSEPSSAKTVDMACQIDFEECVLAVVSPTPQKQTSLLSDVDSDEFVLGSLSHDCDDLVMDDVDDSIDPSKFSSFRDDSGDKTYVCSEDNSDEGGIVTDRNYVNEPMYIVFGYALDEVIVRLKCSEYECPVDPDVIRKEAADMTILGVPSIVLADT